MGDIVLSAGVRQNLLSLQNTADLMSTTQNRLATGKRVNSALDNPNNFFTSSALQSRAGDLNALLDSMSIGIKTLEAADNGLSSITKTVESMQSTLRQARQDKTFKTKSYTLDTATIGTASIKTIGFAGGATGAAVGSEIDVNLNQLAVSVVAATLTAAGGTDASVAEPDYSALVGQTVTLTAGTNTATYTFTAAATGQKTDLLAALNANGFTAAGVAGGINLSRADGVDFTITTSNAATATALGHAGAAAGITSTNGVEAVAAAVKTVDALVTEINANTTLNTAIRASNDNGKLRIENLSTSDLSVEGVGTDGEIDGTTGTATIDGNDVRKNLAKQFNELRDQLNKLSDDASFNGINLLRGDKLKITFNETGTSTIEVQAKDQDGNVRGITTADDSLDIDFVLDADFDSDARIDELLDGLSGSLNILRSQSSNFGSNLSIVENRTEFTKQMINTLQTGADTLVLADSNEEAANMLALQTRQQLSQTALSLASQADQAVLRLFG
jgi:flagellin